MSTERNSPPLPSPTATHSRRASVTNQTFQDLFARQNSAAAQQATPAHPGPITTAAVNAQRRRLSLTTLGLSAPPNQTSFPNARQRTESLSSATSGSVDESPFEDELPSSASASNPATPFARRLSFGARALRDVRQCNGNIGNSNGRSSIHHKASSPPTARGLGEGYNFAENLRSRAERSSISGAHPMLSAQSQQQQRHRAKSVTIMEPPVREMPKQVIPDPMQERILKGDFYMD